MIREPFSRLNSLGFLPGPQRASQVAHLTLKLALPEPSAHSGKLLSQPEQRSRYPLLRASSPTHKASDDAAGISTLPL
jgi:hypothetical protein